MAGYFRRVVRLRPKSKKRPAPEPEMLENRERSGTLRPVHYLLFLSCCVTMMRGPESSKVLLIGTSMAPR